VRPFAITLACCITIGAQSPLGTQPSQRFRAGVDAVRVDVLVTDRNRPVGGLTAADFSLLDNNVPQQIEAMHSEDVPVSMMLTLDASASVAGSPLEDLKGARRSSKAFRCRRVWHRSGLAAKAGTQAHVPLGDSAYEWDSV
jgi:hypothetical protein